MSSKKFGQPKIAKKGNVSVKEILVLTSGHYEGVLVRACTIQKHKHTINITSTTHFVTLIYTLF